MTTHSTALIALISGALLSACGGGGGSSSASTDTPVTPTTPSQPDEQCQQQNTSVQWQALLAGNAEKLSDYQLFQNPCDPTQNPSAGGLIYDLSVPLFTDYASKYRFVFIPEGQKIQYHPTETFEFPVGSVITKTFTMPDNTSERGFANERLLETRLLIKREGGWIARPYVWNADGTEATWDVTGENLVIDDLQHLQNGLSFTYKVPNQNSCTTCHQVNPNGDDDAVDGVDPTPARFSPIGPKARYLNADLDYGQGPENQLQKWLAEGILEGLPAMSEVDSTPAFSDALPLSQITASADLLLDTSKAWLDINCGHCHRKEGQASNTAFRADWNIAWAGNEQYHGACAVAVSGAGESAIVIVPGDADNSLLYQRMHTNEPGDAMPPLGRAIVHEEGNALIKAWINAMDPSLCQP